MQPVPVQAGLPSRSSTTAMKRGISLIGILVMLIIRRPPMPAISIFHKINIVQVCTISRRGIALQFHMN